MSRIGKKVITIPNGVTTDIQKNSIVVKGPKGELKLGLHPHITIAKETDGLVVKIKDENLKSDRSLWGTYGSLVLNMVKGVTEGFKRQLEINGVGYKANMKGASLMLEVGYSHPIEVKPLEGIKFTVEKNLITIEGTDKKIVGEMAAMIRKVRKPEPYKGKGIKYVEETIRRKAGKTAAKGAAA